MRDSDAGEIDWGAGTRERTTFVRRVVAQEKYKGLLLAHSLSSLRTSSLIKIQ